ncbi:hypothetical protein [Veronia pacifica]|uniref:Uncharacterized protein n=1 Tax=Veronia pacifica TaxID=1080227 RepID=A0A1C3EGQ3_9GAMM|nr:hypothetical protein [Veronia pacifica]ODA32427.1 hypothetical protein A8L45_12570 [Veronia pacifica]
MKQVITMQEAKEVQGAGLADVATALVGLLVISADIISGIGTQKLTSFVEAIVGVFTAVFNLFGGNN